MLNNCFYDLQGLQASMSENLPDKGANLVKWEKQIIERIKSIKGGDLTLMQYNENKDNVDVRIAVDVQAYRPHTF